MSTQSLDIDVHEHYKALRYRVPRKGDSVLCPDGAVIIAKREWDIMAVVLEAVDGEQDAIDTVLGELEQIYARLDDMSTRLNITAVLAQTSTGKYLDADRRLDLLSQRIDALEAATPPPAPAQPVDNTDWQAAYWQVKNRADLAEGQLVFQQQAKPEYLADLADLVLNGQQSPMFPERMALTTAWKERDEARAKLEAIKARLDDPYCVDCSATSNIRAILYDKGGA